MEYLQQLKMDYEMSPGCNWEKITVSMLTNNVLTSNCRT